MSPDPIVQVGDPVLRKVAAPVDVKEFGTRALKALVAKMSGALAQEKYGVAIAAPQLGVSKRLFVVAGRAFVAEGESAKGLAVPPDRVFINPALTRLSRAKKDLSEGCLSVRGKYGSVLRNERASIKAQDLEGKPFIYHGSGLIAHIFQHECDHLEGILYIDKASSLRDDPDSKARTVRTKQESAL